jgi:hypothetical protein
MQTLRTILLTAICLTGLYAIHAYWVRTGRPGTAPARSPTTRAETSAPAAQPDTAPPTPTTEPASPEVMPVDGPSLEKFQEANSLATIQLAATQPDVPYAVAASRAARQAISALGNNPDQTLLYWLSPQFAEDVAAGDPAAAVSTRRTVDNLLSILLGDTAGPEDFARIMSECTPEVRALASKRRER